MGKPEDACGKRVFRSEAVFGEVELVNGAGAIDLRIKQAVCGRTAGRIWTYSKLYI